MINPLNQQAKALENQFFAKLDQKLIEDVRENLEKAPARELLSTISNIKNVEVLDKLLSIGIDAKTFAALTFVPLAAVAWADGTLAEAERVAILKAAENHHIPKDGPGYQLLEKWLQHPPGPELMQAWRHYVQELRKVMEPTWVNALKQEVLEIGRAHV